jgi:PAS domain S-box-containing protein
MKIRTRILAAALAVTAAANVIYGAYALDRERREARERLQSTMQETNQLLRSVIAGPLYDGNVEQLRSDLDSFFLNPDIVRIRLKENRGDIEITRIRETAGTPGERIAERMPIVRGIDELGHIEVTYTTANIERQLAKSRNELVLFSTLLVAGLALVIYLAARGLTRPIDRLTAAVRSMARGDPDPHVELSGAEEVVVLGEGFVQMREAIRRQLAALEEKNRQLSDEIAQRQLAEQERDRLISVLEATTDVVGVADPQGCTLYFNLAGRRLTGLGDGDVTGMPIERFHPAWAHRRVVEEGIPAAARDGTWSGDTALLGADGAEIPVSQVILTHRDAQGRLRYLSTIMRDISERKRTEAALRIKDDAIAASLNAIALADTAGRLSYVNRAFLRMWGYDREDEVVGRPALDFWSDRDQAAKALQGASAAGHWSGEMTARRRDGSDFIALLSAVTIRDDEGKPLQLMGSFIDVTEQRRADEALRRSDERLRLAVSTSRMGIYDHDHVGGTLYWSPELREIYGWDPQEDITLPMFVAQVHPDDRERFADAVRRAHDPAGDGLFEIEYRFLRRDGHERWLTTRARTKFSGEGEARHPVRTVGAALDITERKATERALRELTTQLESRVRERTAELETANRELEAFSYSVSHDLRAPLRAIDGFSRVVLEDHAGQLDAEARSYLDRVRKAVQRMGTLIDDLLQLARVTRAEMRVTHVDLGPLAEDVVAELRAAGPGRRVEVVIGDGLAAEGDAQLLRIVLANLIGNAWKFTAHTPEARIEFGRERREGEDVFFVRDNGAGFDMRYAGKLFGAFQRLHSEREFAGSGVGLATVARIVHRHGGRVWAEGRPGAGATFRFTLPARAPGTRDNEADKGGKAGGF